MQITQGNWQARVNPERGSLGFTRTEAVDMMLLAAGGTYKEIARATGRSPESVKDCLGRAYHKLRVYKATAAVAEAMRRGWIAPLLLALMIGSLGADVQQLRHRPPTRTHSRVSASRQVSRRNTGSVFA
ncbi:hypothetical protein [Vreelandella sp. GE22]